jgi:poly-gamma-glutamate capsule biosynthesis protein CapA/YwtB (metallophosphatase superfamily)
MAHPATLAKRAMKPSPEAPSATRGAAARRRFAAALLLLAGGATAIALPGHATPPEPGAPSLFLAGDTILSQPWSDIGEPRFQEVVAAARAADVAIVNLETVIHTFRGHAQAYSGGAWLSAPPEIAQDLAWAGIDMVGHANNHSFDFGSIGVLENLEFVRGAGIVLAGSGADLQAARAPGYFESPAGRVALVSAASSFPRFGRASPSRPDIRGRPGLNPLRRISRTRFVVTPATAARLATLAQLFGGSGHRFGRNRFKIAGYWFRIGDAHAIHTGRRPEPADLAGNLAAVSEAAANADVVVFSIHSHVQGSWLRDVAHRILDAGADVFLAHGPHAVQGIEIHRGKPIFYGLGDLAFQVEQAVRQPAEAYEFYGLGEGSAPADLNAAKRGGRSESFWPRSYFEGAAALVRFDTGRVSEIRLLPLDLRPEADLASRGTPHRADPELGRRIIEDIADASQRYGTRVHYEPTTNLGSVELP